MSRASVVRFETPIPKGTEGMWRKPYLRMTCETLAKAAPATGMR